MKATITVRVLKTVPLSGRSAPSALKTAFSPAARPRPTSRPTTEAMRPMTKASRITDRRI
jgi:hypothetical protein